MNKNFRSQYETWETMSNAFSRKVEISIARLEAAVQAKKEGTAIPERTQESKKSTIPDIGDEKTVAENCYMKWREDLQKTITEQREKTRKWVETWFRYLHRIGEKKEEKKPSWHFKICSETICYGLVIILGAIWSILCSQLGVTAKCDKGFVPCLSERVLKFSLGVYNLYLTSHNITIEDTGNA